MKNNLFAVLLALLMTFQGAAAAGTDYSTLEALCIAIIVLFLIWIIIMIILIFCCKAYVNKLSQAPCADEDQKPGRSDGNSNQAYQGTVVRSYSDPKVHPEPQYRRPEVREQCTQTDPSELEPLGPDQSVQVPDDPEEQFRPPHRLEPLE